MIEVADGVDQAVSREESDHYIERNEPMIADAQYAVTQESPDAFRARLDYKKASVGML